MALPAPYWLQPNPNRGAAPTLDALPPKLDLLLGSFEDIDYTFEFLLSEAPDVYEPTDDNTVQVSVWSGGDSGSLTLIDTLTEADGRVIVGAGTVRIIVAAAQHQAWGAVELFYNLGWTDTIARLRQKLGGKLIFVDRLRTVAG